VGVVVTNGDGGDLSIDIKQLVAIEIGDAGIMVSSILATQFLLEMYVRGWCGEVISY
jgi:hypothetical protein